MTEFTVKCPVIVCTQTARETKSRGNKLLRKPILSGLLESDIVTVRDMSEIATENKVYCIKVFTCRNKPKMYFLLGKTKAYFLFLGKTCTDIFSLPESNQRINFYLEF